MTETESKIVQLLKSDDDCNKILGLMLGRNELGISGLLSLIEESLQTNASNNIVISFKINDEKWAFVIGLGTMTSHRIYRNGIQTDRFTHIYDNSTSKFAKFLNKVL